MDEAGVNRAISVSWNSYGYILNRPIRALEQVRMSPQKPNTESSVAVSTPAATRTILIVDDDPSVTETFERMLRLEGYHVVTALSAEAGLNQAERSQPHAIILDLRMPLVDGLQFLRTLRSKDARSEEHTSELQSLRHLVCR